MSAHSLSCFLLQLFRGFQHLLENMANDPDLGPVGFAGPGMRFHLPNRLNHHAEFCHGQIRGYKVSFQRHKQHLFASWPRR